MQKLILKQHTTQIHIKTSQDKNMNLHSYIKMSGKLEIKKYDENNELVLQVEVPNLVVTAGKQHIAERIISDTETKISHMAIGSGSTVPAAANTALVSEITREPLVTAIRSGSNITYTAVFPIGSTGSLYEAGLFNDASGGTMMCRTTFPVISKLATDTIAISWTVTVG